MGARLFFGCLSLCLLARSVVPTPALGSQLGRPSQPVGHRVMAIGDSITMGAGSVGGYRRLLENRLKSSAYKFIFVGTSMENSSGMSFRRHEGHSGWSTNDLIYGRVDQPGLGKVSKWLSYAKPDTVLIMTGTNDPTFLPKQDWAAKYDKLLSQVFAYNAATRVVLISIPKSDNAITGKAVPESICYDIVKSAVAKWKGKGYAIEFADAYSTFNTSRDLSDAYHPNEAGYKKIADAVFMAMQKF